jgi:hypothetical protein
MPENAVSRRADVKKQLSLLLSADPHDQLQRAVLRTRAFVQWDSA